MKRLYIAIIAVMGFTGAKAQLHESISVEGKYVPEVIRVDRVNVFPKAMNFSLASSPMEYEWGGVAAAFQPYAFAMPATGWRDTHEFGANRGYVELGAGSWLNSTLSAGYRFIDDAHTLAGIRLQHNSTSLWKPQLCELTKDERQYRYDESIGLYASHIFKGIGRLEAALDYHLGLFNYYGMVFPDNYLVSSITPPAYKECKFPTQTVNDMALRLDWHSLLKASSSLQYDATFRIRHLGFRALPLPIYGGGEKVKGNRETDVQLGGRLRMPWDNGSTIGLDANLNVLVYGGEKDALVWGSPGMTELTLRKPDNYGMLTLTPYYRFTHGLLDLRLGADIDLAFNAGPDGNRYSFFHIAPDVRFSLQSGGFGMYLDLLGGSELNTLANLRRYDYYLMPALTTTRPTYSPLDAAFGVNAGPFAGFSMGVNVRYRSSKNVPLGGWYQAWLNYGNAPVGGLSNTSYTDRMEYSLNSEGINLHGYSVGANISYEPMSMLRLKAEGNWQQQKGEKGFFNGYDRPRVTARFEAMVKPIEPLKITVGYDYRGVRNIYTTSVPEVAIGGLVTDGGKPEYHSLRLPDLTLLNLSASWSFTPALSVWVQGDNLLNRHDPVLPCLPTQGVVVTAGFSWLIN